MFLMKKNSFTLVLSSCLTLFSQEQNKPKVGLVLSGGGIKVLRT
jgi:NTE family protein